MNSNLFDNKWFPVTKDIGLIKGNIDDITNALISWHKSIGIDYEIRKFESIDNAFLSLEPLSIAKNKKLFIQTKSDWILFIQNGVDGSDPFPIMSFLANELQTESMKIYITDETLIWEFYESKLKTSNLLGIKRSIYLDKSDSGKWKFEISGKPFEFEKTSFYEDKFIQNRFNIDLLKEYLEYFGIKIFDENFYKVSKFKNACLLNQITKLDFFEKSKKYSFKEIRDTK